MTTHLCTEQCFHFDTLYGELLECDNSHWYHVQLITNAGNLGHDSVAWHRTTLPVLARWLSSQARRQKVRLDAKYGHTFYKTKNVPTILARQFHLELL